jgi:DNA-binding LacI/PurR family transcriptional regulator
MAVTSKDIAARLGISQPTVSRILNGDKQYKVSDRTRELIFSTAAEMGYRPNALARSLRNKRTDVIGLYTPPNVLDTRQEFFAYLYGGLQRSCETYHVDILVHKTYEGRVTADVFGEMIDGRTDGVVIYVNPLSPLVPMLQKSKFPVVALADPLAGIPSVGCEDAVGMSIVMDYLWTRGYRRYAYLAPNHHPTTVERRYAAFDGFLEQKGIARVDRRLISIDNEHAEPALDDLLQMGNGPTAVCCWNDRAAYVLVRECLARGVKIPEDIAVVGFDGFLDSKIPVLDLVTVRVPWYEMARKAVDLLIDRVNGKDIPAETLLPVEFLAGNTA